MKKYEIDKAVGVQGNIMKALLNIANELAEMNARKSQ